MPPYRPKTKYFSVFVGKLPLSITKGQIEELFKVCGEIGEIFISGHVKEHHTYTYGFVRFVLKESAMKAVNTLNGWPVLGEKLSVEMTREPNKVQEYMQDSELSRQRRTAVMGRPEDQDYQNLSHVMVSLAALRKNDKDKNDWDPIEILKQIAKADSRLVPAFTELPKPGLDVGLLDSLID